MAHGLARTDRWVEGHQTVGSECQSRDLRQRPGRRHATWSTPVTTPYRNIRPRTVHAATEAMVGAVGLPPAWRRQPSTEWDREDARWVALLEHSIPLGDWVLTRRHLARNQRRIELDNHRSRKVAVRSGHTLEGVGTRTLGHRDHHRDGARYATTTQPVLPTRLGTPTRSD